MILPVSLFRLPTPVMPQPGPAAYRVLHAAPDGSDAWTGNRRSRSGMDGPIATLDGARRAVRKLRKAGFTGAIEVRFASGEYRLTQPVVFTGADSGTENGRTIYESEPGARPLFEGGRRVAGLRLDKDGIGEARLPDVAAGRWYFEQLWINGRRAARAQSPNLGYFYTAGRAAAVTDPATGRKEELPNQAFRAAPQDVAALLKLTPEELHDVEVVAYQSWEVSLLRIAAVDPLTNTVITTGPAMWPFEQWGPHQRYRLVNLRAALDAPGTWFLSRTGLLLYRPLPGEKLTKADVEVPVCSRFIKMEGTASEPVRHITFRGLTFQYGQFLLPPEGRSDAQAAFSMPAAIQADYAQDVRLERCELAHLGTYAAWFRRGCSGCSVQHCYLHDLGAGGVRIGEGSIRPVGPDRTGSIVVENTIIHECGYIDAGAVGVWIGQSGGNRITHNDIG
ncbi:MAG TPA: right-handed parallel beta-helix repeat-containing protein, partial [Chthonomonadales bacterium]|nr:right-handed parallel beta-helix repeat-containing protein [Chthonomonadales bacterium]